MRIDIQIPAHLRHQVAADFFLPILEGGVFFAEVQATMAALTFIGHKLAGDLRTPRQLLYSPLEFRTLHTAPLSDRYVRTSSIKMKCGLPAGRACCAQSSLTPASILLAVIAKTPRPFKRRLARYEQAHFRRL